jgi:hypothetical protein
MRQVIDTLRKVLTAKDRMIAQKDTICTKTIHQKETTIRQKDATIEYQYATIRQLCLSHQLADAACREVMADADFRHAEPTPQPSASPTATHATGMNNEPASPKAENSPFYPSSYTSTGRVPSANTPKKPLPAPSSMSRRLTACTMDAGLCSNWNQDTGDNFDWTLTSEGTPTSNTGPSTGSGGEGAFVFIEANDQAEGDIASITSSNTGCGLIIDYHMYGGGIGTLTVSAKNAADGEDAAWVPVWTKEGDQGGDSWQAATISSASGSYYRVTATRGGANRGDIAIDNMNLVVCTPAPTLAPTNVGQHPICNFNAGFCDWTQDGDNNFDWTLTSEGTPTSNTGPSTGSGHGGGAFIHIEANDQTEGAYAAITSSTTGCGLSIDYHMYGGGIGTLTVSAKDAADGEDAAWAPVWTKEGGQGDSWQAATIYSASSSYYQVMATRGGGIRGDIAIDNLNVMWCTDAPTASPTNVGDTHAPTVSPTISSMSRLSFALLFNSIRAFFAKELSQIFAPIPGGEHGTTFDWMVLPRLPLLGL